METEIDLKQEILRLSAQSGFSPRLIEKDYYLTKILHKISEKQIKDLVFKGGTCLNKCYLGFYRLSEDLDFVLNQDVWSLSKSQMKKTLDDLRRELFQVLNELSFETNKEIGKGWKMLTSNEDPKIVGLEVIVKYKSILDDSVQSIKIEVSFRKKLVNQTKKMSLHHEFVNALGEPLLNEDVELEVIDLTENFAEKFRALVTRKNIAIRDVYDISFILEGKILPFDDKVLNFALAKINETQPQFTKQDFKIFIESLDKKAEDLDEREILAVLKNDQKINIKEMVEVIKHEALNSLKG
jgi:predicted nucleotidyltransferase component of viral defense system